MGSPESHPPPLEGASIDILVAAASNDPEARERLVERLTPEVARYWERRLDLDAAMRAREDVARDICVAVVEALPTYDHEHEDFWSFIFGVASHRVADSQRTTVRDAGPNGEASVAITEIVDRLPANQRSILLLRLQAPHTVAETAHLLDLTPASARVVQHRALTTIRRALRDTSGPCPGAARSGR